MLFTLSFMGHLRGLNADYVVGIMNGRCLTCRVAIGIACLTASGARQLSSFTCLCVIVRH